MPLYQQIVIARDIAKVPELTRLLQQCAKTVYDNGGVVRAVENHGIRALNHRLRNRRANEEEQKYHWRARYVSTYFDANPKTLKELERVLRLNENVLRFFTIKTDPQANFIRTVKGWKARTWESYSLDEMEKQKERAKREVFDEQDLKGSTEGKDLEERTPSRFV